MERMTGFEPATSTLARWRSSQLSRLGSIEEGFLFAKNANGPVQTLMWRTLLLSLLRSSLTNMGSIEPQTLLRSRTAWNKSFHHLPDIGQLHR